MAAAIQIVNTRATEMTRVRATGIITLLICSLVNSASVTTNNNDSKVKTKDVTQTDIVPEATHDQDDMSVLETAMNECNETFRTEMSYIISLNESGSFPDETDRTPKCFVRCVLETTGVASDDGQYDPVETALVFPKDRGGKHMDDLEDMAKACTNRKETCKCERAYQFVKCFMETQIKKYSETN